MASIWYNSGKADVLKGDIDLNADDIRVLLATASYTPDPDHDFVNDITNELSGGNYVRKALANESVAVDNANDRADFKADNVTWTALTGAPRYAIYFKQVTSDADHRLLVCNDLGAQSVAGVDFTIKHDGQASNGAVARLT